MIIDLWKMIDSEWVHLSQDENYMYVNGKLSGIIIGPDENYQNRKGDTK